MPRTDKCSINLKILATAVVLLVAGFATPSKAQNTYNNSPVQPNQVPNACIQNQSETLSVPKSDVSPNHWAFKAVMTMHYCGAFRQATPTTLWQQLIPTESQQAPQKKPQNSGS